MSKDNFNRSLSKILSHDIKSPLFIIKNYLNKVRKNYSEISHIEKMDKSLYLIDELLDSVGRTHRFYHEDKEFIKNKFNVDHVLKRTLDVL